MIIYLDILIALNLFVNYFLLLASAVIAQIEIKRLRLALTATLGSVFSLSIFIPDEYAILVALLKIPMGLLLVLIGFGYKSKNIFIKTTLIFLAVNFIFAGVIFLVWIVFQPKSMVVKNGVFYMALSPLILIIGTIMSYFIVKVINIILSKRTCYKSICDLDIYMEDEKIQVKALLDTGNKLTDPFSGLPVVVWEYSDASKIIPPDLDKFFCEPSKYTEDLNASEWKKKVRLIPCDTVAGKTILPAFKPQKIIIDKKGINKDISAYLAITTNRISDGEYHAIIGNIN